MLVNRSKSGLPTLMESGGGCTNTGGCYLICGLNGEKLNPLFIPRGYSNGDHAIFVVKPGICVVYASHDRRTEYVSVKRIVSIGTETDPDEVILELVGEWENGDGNIPSEFDEVVKSAKNKSHCYHCREMHYGESK